MKQRYPQLWLLLAGYFHQDWDLQAGDWQSIVDRYSAREDSSALSREIHELLRGMSDDEDLEEAVFVEAGCAYDPRPDQSVRAWLRDIADHSRGSADK